jgi:hypothetical protein
LSRLRRLAQFRHFDEGHLDDGVDAASFRIAIRLLSDVTMVDGFQLRENALESASRRERKFLPGLPRPTEA